MNGDDKILRPVVSRIEGMILKADYGRHPHVSRQMLERSIAARRALCPEPHYILVRVEGSVIVDADAQYFIGGPPMAELTRAMAMCMTDSSFLSQFAYQQTLAHFKPRFPVALFDREADALAWLREIQAQDQGGQSSPDGGR